jgi:2-polyprenyl-3-methyl-5-hydroxy-6-metoxy-1,4-benzoquinol methylase
MLTRTGALQTLVTTERLERTLILKLLGDVRDLRILDVGCGDGEFAIELARRGAIVTGIDASAVMVDAAKASARRHDLEVPFQVARAEQLPFPAEQFHALTAITMLCFVADAAPVFREMVRVLRPGGRLVIGELGKWSPWAAGRRIRAWLGSPLWRQARFTTASQLRKLAEGADLAVEGVRGAIYYPRCRLAARVLAPFDAKLSRLTIGAAFLALSAVKRKSAHKAEWPGGRVDHNRIG